MSPSSCTSRPGIFQATILKTASIIFIIATEFVISTTCQFSSDTSTNIPSGPPGWFLAMFCFVAVVVFVGFCAGIAQVCRSHCASVNTRIDYDNSMVGPVVAAPVYIHHNEWQGSISTITGQGMVLPSAPHQPAQYSYSTCQHSTGPANDVPPPYNFAHSQFPNDITRTTEC